MTNPKTIGGWRLKNALNGNVVVEVFTQTNVPPHVTRRTARLVSAHQHRHSIHGRHPQTLLGDLDGRNRSAVVVVAALLRIPDNSAAIRSDVCVGVSR